MRSFWCITVMISVLFMSVDGAADSVIKGHAHGDGATHVADNIESNPPGDTEPDSDHCERCCHGHSASISVTVAEVTAPFVTADQHTGRSGYVRNFAQAPPTPPPNA
jgi:hypothetical protein